MPKNTKTRLLKDIFWATRAEPNGVTRRTFLAKHPDDVHAIDELTASGEIQCRDGEHLRLPLLGLVELADVLPAAESVRYLCAHLFDVLRVEFIEHPDAQVSQSDVAALADMPERKVAQALEYLMDAPIFDGWSTSADGFRSQIQISDLIVKYRTFSDVIDAMRSQERLSQSEGIQLNVTKRGANPDAKDDHLTSISSYVDSVRINELKMVASKDWDLKRLIRMCEELNSAFDKKSFIACSMLVRGIVDHVPPIFRCNTFSEVANNYAGSKSFRSSMRHLDQSLRNLADGNLHTQIRRTESLPTEMQIKFWADLDKLLEEIVRISHDDSS